MFGKKALMYIYAETPIHPGSGATLGAVDLPIQRERHTNFPIIQGSSLKGVLRSAFKEVANNSENSCKKELENKLFGDSNSIGGVSITDARILAFPVRTIKNVFSWVTCPLVLERYKRDLNIAGFGSSFDEIGKVDIRDDEAVPLGNGYNNEKSVFVEDIKLNLLNLNSNNLLEKRKDITDAIKDSLPENDVYKGVKERLGKYLLLISDNTFRSLVTLTTEVFPRIRINENTGTVQAGGLWSEEYLPSDTIMYSLILIPKRPSNNENELVKCIKMFDNAIVQIGGNETIGKGFVMLKVKSA